MKKAIIVILMFLISCKEYSYVGKYSDGNKIFHLELRKDSTFLYTYFYDRINANSSGRWLTKSHKKILLISTPLTTKFSLNIKESESRDLKNHIFLEVNHLDREKYEYNIYFNDTLFKKIKIGDSTNFITNFKIKSINMEVYRRFDYWMNVPPAIPYNTSITSEILNLTYYPRSENIVIQIPKIDSLFYFYPFNHSVIGIHGSKIHFEQEKDLPDMRYN